MAGLDEKQKVWVRQSRCGYQGPAETIGLVYGSAWLVKKLEGDESIILVRAEFLEPLVEKQAVPEGLSKEEKKELKRKYKTERKNHTPSNGGGRCGRR